MRLVGPTKSIRDAKMSNREAELYSKMDRIYGGNLDPAYDVRGLDVTTDGRVVKDTRVEARNRIGRLYEYFN